MCLHNGVKGILEDFFLNLVPIVAPGGNSMPGSLSSSTNCMSSIMPEKWSLC